MSSKKPPKQKKKKVHSRLEGKMIVMGPGVGSLLLHGHCGGERASTRELLCLARHLVRRGVPVPW